MANLKIVLLNNVSRLTKSRLKASSIVNLLEYADTSQAQCVFD